MNCVHPHSRRESLATLTSKFFLSVAVVPLSRSLFCCCPKKHFFDNSRSLIYSSSSVLTRFTVSIEVEPLIEVGSGGLETDGEHSLRSDSVPSADETDPHPPAVRSRLNANVPRWKAPQHTCSASSSYVSCPF